MNEALMTIGEFAEMLGSDIQIKGAPGIKFSSVSFDSRSVRPNGLFFAIEGERDGHEFVQAASDAGRSGGGRDALCTGEPSSGFGERHARSAAGLR